MHKKNKKYSVLVFLVIINMLQSCLRDGDSHIKIPLEFKGVEVVNSTTVKLKFSKDLAKSTASKLANYFIINTYDSSEAKILPVKTKVQGNEVLLTFAKNIIKKGVTYQVTFKNLTSTDGSVLGSYGFNKIAPSNEFEIFPEVEWVSKSLSIKRDTRYYFSFSKKELVTIPADDVSNSLEWDFYIELNGYMLITPNASEVEGASGGGKMVSTDDSLDKVKKGEPYIQASGTKNQGLSILAPYVDTNRFPWCKRIGDNHFEDETKPVEILDKTIVFKTAKDDYGKMKIHSVYKGNPPNPVTLSFKNYLLKFEYVVQTDHSDNLDIKK